MERNILSNPFKRFADMLFLQYCRDIEWVEVNPNVWRKLINDVVQEILEVCDVKLVEYYDRDGLK